MASPGATRPINTPVAPALAAASIFRLTPQAPRSIRAILPLGSAKYGSAGLPGLMEPADVTSLYLFLASDLARNITGQAINVDRGEVMA